MRAGDCHKLLAVQAKSHKDAMDRQAKSNESVVRAHRLIITSLVTGIVGLTGLKLLF